MCIRDRGINNVCRRRRRMASRRYSRDAVDYALPCVNIFYPHYVEREELSVQNLPYPYVMKAFNVESLSSGRPVYTDPQTSVITLDGYNVRNAKCARRPSKMQSPLLKATSQPPSTLSHSRVHRFRCILPHHYACLLYTSRCV